MRSYNHFTFIERENLWLMLEKGQSLRSISAELGRSPSTISRELKRNRNKDESYNAWRACCLYLFRRKKSRRKYRLDQDISLKKAVCLGLDNHWSPEIIAAKYNEANPNSPVSHGAIYRAMKRGGLSGYSEKKHLRRAGKRKYCRGDNATIKPENRIGDRPEIVEKRGRIGDWEVDTVLGVVGRGGLVSAVDRRSRFLVLELIKNKTATETEQAVCRALRGKKVETLTMDNGSEFANFKSMEKKLETKIFFADPHSPWQRGTNENINGLIRWFFPKGCDFLNVDDQQIRQVQDIINNRPRKCLGWLTPKEVSSVLHLN